MCSLVSCASVFRRVFDVLEHCYGVGSGRNRCAGHDFPGGSGRQRARWGISGAGCASDGQRRMSGGFGGTAGIAVTGGAGEGGLIKIGQQRLGEDAACRLTELDLLLIRPHPAPLRGVGCYQRSGLVKTGKSGAG